MKLAFSRPAHVRSRRLRWLFGVVPSLGVLAMAHGGVAERVVRSTVAGIDLIACPAEVRQVVTIVGLLPAGNAHAHAAGGNPAIAILTSMLLDEGTTARDKFAIAQSLENVGASISFGSGNQVVTVRAQCLRPDLPLIIGLIAEQLRAPALSPEEFAKAQKQLAGSLRNQLDNTGARASEMFARAVFPAGHPNAAVPTEELLAAVQRATIDEVRAFHARHYGPQHMKLVVVGDIDVRAVQAAVADFFQGWTGGVEVVGGAGVPPLSGDAQVLDVFMADKTSVNIVWGQPSRLRAIAPEALTLRVATAVLGSGFTGRLMNNVRDREGLTYGIGATLTDDTFNDGAWYITATFAPALLEQGIASTRRQLERWHREGITADELAARKTNLVGSFNVSLATTGGLANALLDAVNAGREVSWLDEYPQKIMALAVEEVNAVIRQHIDPARMVLVKAGTIPEAAATAP